MTEAIEAAISVIRCDGACCDLDGDMWELGARLQNCVKDWNPAQILSRRFFIDVVSVLSSTDRWSDLITRRHRCASGSCFRDFDQW